MASLHAQARLPLLERLADRAPLEPHEAPPLRMLDRAGLRASVGRELERLLNTRAAPRRGAAASVIDYGLPDWTGLYAANPDDRAQIARGVRRTLRVFEPRLHQLEVEVEADTAPGGQERLRVRLRGELRSDGASWPVAFGVSFGRDGGAHVVEDGP